VEYDAKAYWERRFAGEPGLATTGFAGMGLSFNRWLYRGYRAALRLALKRSAVPLGPNTRVIDAGAGGGFFVEFCRARAVRDLVGLDLTAASVDFLTAGSPNTSSTGSIWAGIPMTRRPRRRRGMSVGSLSHRVREGFEAAIENLARMTKVGGHLVIADNFLPIESPYEPGVHQRHWSKDEFERRLDACGFRVLRYQPVSFLLNAPVRFKHTRWGKAYAGLWNGIQKRVAGVEWRGNVFGCAAYLVDRPLQRLLRAGPGAHYLFCRKT